ncbi:MAG: TonB-dependent receptor [Bryobacteraceae bacterium]|nr:TonB-dependent receptor [Bryobacteraceae bacterium]
MRWALGFLLFSSALSAQTTATLTGSVTDPTGQAIQDARVTLENAITGYRHETLTDPAGAFAIANIPPQNYLLTIDRAGFAADRQTVVLRSNVPVRLAVQLQLAGQTSRVDVSAYESRVLIEPEATGTRTELNAASIERLPIAVATRGLEAVLATFPGFAVNANGAVHPRGAHNQMTFVVDGMPITDQLTGSFANAVDPAIVESIELHTGNIPPEFGSKVSGVAVVTTRSGLAAGRGFSGSTQVAAAQFGTLSQVTQVGGGVGKLGYFASFNTLKTNRFLDQVSLDNLHNGGNSERAFARLDYSASPRDVLRLNLMSGRSSFQLANLRSQHAAGQQQRQRLVDASASLGWVRTIDARTTVDATASWRGATAQLYPSPGDTPVTAAQARRLTTVTLGARFNRVEGPHVIRAGADLQRFPVREHFTFGVTDPAFNAPGDEQYNPSLAAFDLSRGGRLFQFSKRATGGMYTGFAQDNVRWGRFQFALGVRYDAYRFLVNGNQLQPRLGLSFHLRETGTVFRASYNRTYQTPPNENLLLSSSPESTQLAPPVVRDTLGGGLILIQPERQNVYEVGLQQALGGFASVNASYYHKNSRDLQDNDNFLNTGIIFPTTLSQSRVNGAELRLVVPKAGRLSGSLAMTHYRAIVTPPFTGGLFLGSTALDALSAGPFIIDHDQTLSLNGVLHYTISRGWWASTSIRYDSGLVSNPSNPDEVRRDPDYADLLPYVNLNSDPTRVRPRTITDLAVGYVRTSEGRRRWEASVQVTNLANATALYNFQSIFVGTRLVQPRTAGFRFRLFF